MPEPNLKAYFNQKRTAPEIKSVLLPEIFKVWLEGMLSEDVKADDLVFADVNAGVGFDGDGNALAPIKTLQAIEQQKEALKEAYKTVRAIFLDASKPTVAKLKTDLESQEFYEELSTQIQVSDHQTLPENFIQILSSGNPVLLASDPFSSDFTGRLLLQLAAQKQTDCWLLFTPAKLKAALFPDKKTSELNVLSQQLFDEKWAETEQIYKGEKSAKKREQLLLDQFGKALQDSGRYVLLFQINQPGKDAAAYYLMLATFNKQFYLHAKELLLPYSDWQEDGVPLFGVNLNYRPASIPGFSTFLNRYSLGNLMHYLAGNKSLYHYETVQKVFENHSPGTNYVMANYLAAFKQLQEQGQVNLLNEKNRQVNTITGSSVVFYKLHRS